MIVTKDFHDQNQLFNRAHPYRPSNIRPEIWEIAWSLVPNDNFWRASEGGSYVSFLELPHAALRNRMGPEILALGLLSEQLASSSSWNVHGNGHISRKFGTGLSSVTFVIDVCGTINDRLQGDMHISLFALTWIEEHLLQETSWRSLREQLRHLRICVLPSYEAASCDSCLAIAMAAEGCSLDEMFELVQGSRRQVTKLLQGSRETLDCIFKRMSIVCSTAPPELYNSWGLEQFEKLARPSQPIVGDETSMTKSPLGEDLHPRSELWEEVSALSLLDLGIPIWEYTSRSLQMAKAISRLQGLQEKSQEFPQLSDKLLVVEKRFQDEKWTAGHILSGELESNYEHLREVKERRLAQQSRANELILQASRFMETHQSLTETHEGCYLRANEMYERGIFDEIHNTIKPLIRRGNEMDVELLVSSSIAVII